MREQEVVAFLGGRLQGLGLGLKVSGFGFKRFRHQGFRVLN